jgi:hypothetical protein
MMRASNTDCLKGMTRLPNGSIVTKAAAHVAGYDVPGYSARKNRDQAMKDLGMKKVKGASAARTTNEPLGLQNASRTSREEKKVGRVVRRGRHHHPLGNI